MGHDDGGWDRAIGLDNRGGPFRYSAFTGNGPGPAELPGPTSTEVHVVAPPAPKGKVSADADRATR